MSATNTVTRALGTLYRRIFHRQEDAHLREIAATLQEVPLFRHFSSGVLREMAQVMHVRRYRREEYLYYEGDPGMGMYVVKQGRVRLLSGMQTTEVREVRQVLEKECFGELSLLGNFRRMETAQALTEATVLGFFSPDLKMMLKRNPQAGAEVALALARTLAARQVELLQMLEEAEGKEAARRLLHGALQRYLASDIGEEV